MSNSKTSPAALPQAKNARDFWQRWLGRLSIVLALAFALALAWRPINSNDIGYHLAYGDTFLETGRIVDGNDFIYTEIDPASLSVPGNLPPGAWYDHQSHSYHFPNANYASQIVMSLVYKAAGFTGLCLLQVGLVAATFILMLLAMRRLGISRLWMTVGCVLAALVAYERFNLRPEMFGFVFLAAILFLLCRPRIGVYSIAALVLVQWAFVQVHSYWLLGLAIVGAFWAEAILRAIWARTVTCKPLNEEQKKRLRIMTVTIVLMAAVALVNPWTWRLAFMPIQTLLFLRTHAIAAGALEGPIHPWATIGEFFSPMDSNIFFTRPTYAYMAVLAITAIGTIASLMRRKWAYLAAMLGMIFVSLNMRRNIAPAALIMLPLAMAAVGDLIKKSPLQAATKAFSSRLRYAGLVSAIALLTLTAYLLGSVVTNHFYYTERRSWRFGGGPTTRDIPITASAILKSMPTDVRVFASYNVSSTVLYFSRDKGRYREVPIVTNTWAFPAEMMAQNLGLCGGGLDFNAFAKQYNVGIVVLDCTRNNSKLVRILLHHDKWTPVHFDGFNIVFARIDLDLPETLGDFRDADEWISQIKAEESVPVMSLHTVASSLYMLGVDDQAEKFWRACISLDENFHEGWNMLGVVLAMRGRGQLASNKQAGVKNLEKAREHFQKALSIRPNYEKAKKNLSRADSDLAILQR